MAASINPADALGEIAFLLERELAPTAKVKAFRKAHDVVSELSIDELHELDATNKLTKLDGIGKSSAQVISEALAGNTPEYLQKARDRREPEPAKGAELRAALRGDCHSHSTWSDGGASVELMARTARSLGHEYLTLTDHSPNLKVANGLTVERLHKQWEEIDALNETFAREASAGDAPTFRILKGIEVDILEDGSLDQTDEVLKTLDVVVGSVHSKLRSDKDVMTKRMLDAIENPFLDILGHCTGRKVTEPKRPESDFDHEAVFKACAQNNVVVEINSRRERKDPPIELMKLAKSLGCSFSIDTDAHAPGQLDWQFIGCERAAICGIDAGLVVNTKTADELCKTFALKHK